MNLDALITCVSRGLEGAIEDGHRSVLVHVDTMRDILEELTRLQDLER